MIRTPQALIPYVLAFALVAAGWLWHLGDSVPGTGRVTEQGVATIGGPFALIDQTGAPRRDSDFRGKFMLVYFGFSNCPDICPTTLGVMAEALEKLGPRADRFVPIFITTDPSRDTPAILAQYMKAFGPSFVGLTGDAASVEAAGKAYRVYAKRRELPGGGYAMDHTSILYLMDAKGEFVRHYNEGLSPDELAADLAKHL
jgi:protein SCO1/2